MLLLLLLLLVRSCRSVLHIHTIVEECEVTKLVHAVDMKTKEQKKVRQRQIADAAQGDYARRTCMLDEAAKETAHNTQPALYAVFAILLESNACLLQIACLAQCTSLVACML